MNKRYKSYTKESNELGQSLVEFALSLVIILTLLAGVVELGRVFFAYIIIRDAAQEGAVFGSIAPKSDLTAFENGVEARVITAFTDPTDSSNVPLNISKINVQTTIYGSSCAAPGNGIEVRVEYSLPVTMPFLGAVIGSQEINMSASVENPILAPICP
jgi:Flp pilus assembly protein TadG